MQQGPRRPPVEVQVVDPVKLFRTRYLVRRQSWQEAQLAGGDSHLVCPHVDVNNPLTLMRPSPASEQRDRVSRASRP